MLPSRLLTEKIRMAIQRVEAALGDDYDALTKTAAGTLTAGHIVRVEYEDTAETQDLYQALRKLAERVLTLEP